MMDIIYVCQRITVDGIECLITRLAETTEQVQKCPTSTPFRGPFARIIALPGTNGRTREAAMTAIAGKTSPI